VICAVLALVTFGLLEVLAFRHLRAAQYSVRDATILIALLSVQLAGALSASAFHALLLALTLFISAKAAMEFTVAQSARGVIALGLSLAAVQIVSPAGLTISAVIVPTLAAAQGPVKSRKKDTGLLLLLLFTPLVSAAIFAYLAREFQFRPWAYMTGPFDHLIHPQIFDRMGTRRNGLIDAIAMIAVALPVWLMAPRSARAGLVAIVCGALVIAVAIAALLRRSYSFGAFVPALGVLSLLAVAELRHSPERGRRAIAILATSAVVSWLFLTASP
jgi:hypothetical protein